MVAQVSIQAPEGFASPPSSNGTYSGFIQPGLALQAATPVTGFALQDATPTILSWTPPDDGQMHRVMILADERVTAAMTGGALSCNGTDPGGAAFVNQIDGGGHVVSFARLGVAEFLVQGGSEVTLVQSSAMTAGAATLWAEIWGS